jgi:DNA polymerase-3 subunit gamma/tau
VDDIRELIGEVRIPPQMGKYKIYIIDEVHMLSSNAFNAFLKTLEEPPPHAMFILATTEKHKIIPTILSRCQIFDFKRIQARDISAHLAWVAQQEGVETEPEALDIIADKSDGAMRDALSLFDQMVNFTGKQLTYKKVIENLNVLDYEYYFKVTSALLANEGMQALMVFDEILSGGFDGHHFTSGLSEHFRNLLVAKNAASAQLLLKGGLLHKKYLEEAAKYPEWFLFGGLNLLNQCDINYKMAVNQRLLVELTLLKICHLITAPAAEPKPVEEAIKKPAPATTSVIPPVQAHYQKPPATEAETETKKDIPKKMITVPPISRFTTEKSIENEHKANITDAATSYSNPILPQELAKVLKEFIELNKEKKSNLCSILNVSLVDIDKDNPLLLIVTIENSIQQQAIEKEKTALIDFLNSRLNKQGLQIKFNMEEITTARKPYTAQEKLKYMTDKNPLITKAIEQWDLKLDM